MSTKAEKLRERFLAAEAFVEPSWSNHAVAAHLKNLRQHCAAALGRTHHVTVELSHLKSDALQANSTDRLVARLGVLRERAVSALEGYP